MSSLASVLSRLPRPVLERFDRWRSSSALVRHVWAALAPRLRAREVVIARGEAAGLRFDTTGGPIGYGLGYAEADVQAVVAAHLGRGDTFYDVGANIGFFSLIGAERVGPEGRVVAFEPAPETARLLQANLDRNGFSQATIVRKAVADAPGTARFVIPSDNQQGRLPQFERAAAASGESEVEVEVTTLDAEVAAGAPAPTFVKMDIEGAEVAALVGMAETLRAHGPVVLCEVHGTGPEVEAAFERMGYVVEPLADAGAPGAPIPETYHVLARPRRA